jgi:hypothetical protein
VRSSGNSSYHKSIGGDRGPTDGGRWDDGVEGEARGLACQKGGGEEPSAGGERGGEERWSRWSRGGKGAIALTGDRPLSERTYVCDCIKTSIYELLTDNI